MEVMRSGLVCLFFILRCTTLTVAFALPKLPGVFQPEVCLPMSDHSYTGDPDGDVSQEVINSLFFETLFCKRGCCGDSKDAYCCPPEDEEGLGTFQVVSLVAAGIAVAIIITVTSVYFIKKHNKKRRLVGDISAINKMNNKDVSKVKAGHYQKGPSVKNPQKQGKLFKKKQNSLETARPRTPISMLAAPEILPDLTNNYKANPAYGMNQPHYSNGTTNKLEPLSLVGNLKPPSPPTATGAPGPAPSPPLPADLPPPLILPPLATANIDDYFLDSLLATIPLEGTVEDSRPTAAY